MRAASLRVLAARCARALIVLLAAGCAARSAGVGHRMLSPDADARHALAPTELFVMPVTLAAPEPAFPALAEGAKAADVTVCAEVWLSADGEITRTFVFDRAASSVGAAHGRDRTRRREKRSRRSGAPTGPRDRSRKPTLTSVSIARPL